MGVLRRPCDRGNPVVCRTLSVRQAEAISPVGAAADALDPARVVQIPLHGAAKAGIEVVFRLPAQFSLDLGGVDGVAAIVTGSVGHEGDQRRAGCMRQGGPQVIHDAADRPRPPRCSPVRNCRRCCRFRLAGRRRARAAGPGSDPRRTANRARCLPVAVDRQRLALQGIEDHQRDQLFRELVRPVVVRAIGHQRRHSVSAKVRADQVVGRRFRRRVGRTGIVRAGFHELPARPQRTVDFVGGNLQKTERIAQRLRQLLPVPPGGIQQLERALHVRAHEFGGAVDRAIDVGFRREMHDGIGPIRFEDLLDRRAVDNVAANEDVPGVLHHRFQRVEIAGVGQLVEIHDLRRAFGDTLAYEATADKAGAAGDQNRFHAVSRPLEKMCDSIRGTRMPSQAGAPS